MILNELQLRRCLRERYEKRNGYPMEWMFFEEVCESLGSSWEQRRIDAVAVNLFPSRADSDSMHGFEIKVSRSDWLTELRQPEKSEPWRRLCRRWSLVVGDKNIVKEGELPEGWGLIVPGRASGIWTAKKSPINKDAKLPGWKLTCSLLRKAGQQSPPAQTERENARLRKLVEEAWGEGYGEGVIHDLEQAIDWDKSETKQALEGKDTDKVLDAGEELS